MFRTCIANERVARFWPAIAAAMWLSAGETAGQSFVPESQSRRATGFVIVPPCVPNTANQTETAADFGPFEGDVLAELSCASSTGEASATQISTIGAAVITTSGHSASLATASPSTVIHAISSSTFELGFSIAEPRRFLLNATVSAQQQGTSVSYAASVMFKGSDDLPIFSHGVNASAGPTTLAVTESLVLPAGSYFLRAASQAVIDNQIPPDRSGEAVYDVTAALAMPGDVNLDGAMDLADADALAAVLVGAPIEPLHEFGADVNGDGSADGQDVQAFVDVLLDA